MTMLYIFVLLPVSTAFAQSFQQTAQRLNVFQPAVATASSSIAPEAINAFSQLKQVDINTPFLRFFNYSADLYDSSNGENDKSSDGQFQQANLDGSLQNQFQQASDNDGSNSNSPDNLLKVTNSVPPVLSDFAEYNLQVQMYADIYPRLYDVSFSPGDVGEYFYNEAIYFALDNRLYEVGLVPQQLADAAAHAFPSLRPLDYFKVLSNTLELSLQRGGIDVDKNYQVLARLNVKDLEEAMDLLKVDNARSALHAVIVGTGNFFKSLKLNSPGETKYILSTLADQLSKISRTGGVL